jgi:hypothetical protein
VSPKSCDTASYTPRLKGFVSVFYNLSGQIMREPK